MMGIFVFGISTQLCLSMAGVILSCDQLFVVDPKTKRYNGWKPWIGATFATCGTTLASTALTLE